MKKLNQMLLLAGAALTLCLSTGRLVAQDQPPQRRGGGNFDPEQARQRMMDRYKEQLDVKDDAEWKLISERIEKVTTARREVGFGGGGGFGRGGRGGPGGGGPGGGQAAGGRGAFGGEPSPEAQALQKAIEAKAPADELKSKLAKFREARKVKEANLEKAQEDLRKVLTPRQEAVAVLAGLLK
jgi:Spy/CpxP family protein refolding chaperone